MAESSPWSFSLTREDILARRLKREEIVAEVEALQQKLADEDRWYEAVRLIAPRSLIQGIEEAIEGAREGPERASIWRDVISDAFKAVTAGLQPRDIVQYIREAGPVEAKDRLIRNPNGIYNALSRMVQDNRLVKHGDKFYLPEVFKHLSEKGEIDEDAEGHPTSGVTAVILSYFDDSSRMLPRDVMSRLRQHEEYAARLDRNPQYGYSAINRLIRQQRLKKDGAFYVLPSYKNEPHDAGASHGSDAELEDPEVRKMIYGH
ncbi:hypothetical protein MKK68_20820 [Methylobacterium sp. E-016]|uniref:hypothetical protein n=1 Tax=Methylobacterium sp. E-016 TaxID=2836556 RepID=UPI001FB97F9D|nr:hypothetical protein [Methylobacterium sp. E-016]MCJ2078057.1 hypothetical protein [Methylobacterium sp. E-016]